MQVVALNWLFAIVVAGTVTPLTLIIIFLLATGDSPEEAVSGGDLFLGAANAIVTGCATLLASRLDSLLTPLIWSLVLIAGPAVVCYAFWALLSTNVLDSADRYDLGLIGGSFAIIVGCAIAFGLVWFSYRDPFPEHAKG
jgi:hypothetical protein